MPEKKVLSARFQASFLMDNILIKKRLLADINLSLIKRAIDINNKIRRKYNADEREINQNINFNIHKDS